MKKHSTLVLLISLDLALALGALSQGIDEGEFSRATLAYKLRLLKNRFYQAEAEVLVRSGTESKIKKQKLELEDVYTKIKRLETEFQRGGYYPDLLDEQMVIVGDDLRIILADPSDTGIDQKQG